MYLITVHGHGPYRNSSGVVEGDGYAAFKERMNVVYGDLFDFIRNLKNLDPEVNILIFSDHKLGLTDFFKSKNYMNEEWSSRAAVDAYYSGFDDNALVSESDQKPFYCFSFNFLFKTLRIENSITNITEGNKFCDRKKGYADYVHSYPDWMFANYLLK